MEKTIRIFSFSGLDEALYKDLNDLGFEIEHFTDGPRAELRQEVIEFIIVSSITFPYQFALSLLEDKLKSLTKKVSTKMFKIWDVLKDSNPAILQSGKDPEHKKPKITLHFKISEDEYSTIDISGKISKASFNRLIDNHFKLIKEQTKNRIKEEKIRKKFKLKKRK
jgi:hypothetical protein